VANSGVITALDGDASQYVRGDGTLADFPTSTGGGSSVSYYLNTSVSQGTIGGVAYKQLSKTPISGAGTDVTISANGYIASYITDANDPALLEVPAGNFNCEFYFSVNSNAHNPYVYAELYKYDGTTFTLLGSSQSIPEYLTNGTTLSAYYFAIPVATAVLTITDRIAVRIYVNVDGRTVTLHTENNHLCQVVTTFSKGLTTLNSLTRQVQFFQTGTSGTDFNISSVTATHTFNIPDASATNRGLITTGTQTIAGAKTFSSFDTKFSQGFFSDYAIKLKKDGSITLVNGYVSIGEISGTGTSKIVFGDGNSSFSNSFLFNTSSDKTYTFPNASGTIALTSDLSSYVPYTGATANVDLGGFDFSAYYINGKQLTVKKTGTAGGAVFIEQGTGAAFGGVSGLAIYTGNVNQLSFSFIDATATNSKSIQLNFSSITNNANRTYTLPDATGTLALTSDIPSLSGLVPYTGATQSVNLGANNFTAGGWIQTGTNTSAMGGGFSMAIGNGTNTYTGQSNSISLYAPSNSQLFFVYGNGTSNKLVALVGNPSDANQSYYNWPSATSGTIALTSDLGSYLPLTGGTLTGQLYINPTNTATVGLDVASNTIRFRSDNLEGFKRQLTIGLSSGTVINMIAQGFGANYGTDMAFYTATTSGVNGTPAMYITGTNNRVGIKTGTPSYDLDINGTFGVSSTSYFAGNIGVGVSSPTVIPGVNLIVKALSSAGNAYIQSLSSDSASSVALYSGNDSADDPAIIYQRSLRFGTSTNSAVTGFSQKMVITNAGNVGIGTSSPSGLLNLAVSSGATIFNIDNVAAQYGNITFRESGAGKAYLQYLSSTFSDAARQNSFEIGTNAASSFISFRPVDTERMRITSGGSVGIGTSTPTGVTGINLVVKALSAAGNGYIQALSSDSGCSVALYSGNSASDDPSLIYQRNLRFGSASDTGTGSYAERMRIASNGVVTITGLGSGAVTATSGVLSATSDMNLKISDGYIDTALDKVLKLTPRYFYWKEETGLPTDLRQLGFYAQEVNEAIGEEGANTPRNENDKWGIYDRALIAMLTKAIQEQQVQIEELKAKIK
jgi:hypothetical protein